MHFDAFVCIIVWIYILNKDKLRNVNYNEATAGFKTVFPVVICRQRKGQGNMKNNSRDKELTFSSFILK